MSDAALPTESPFLKLGAVPAQAPEVVDSGGVVSAEAAEPAVAEASVEKEEGLFPEMPHGKHKGGSLAARFQKLTTDRKAAIETASKLQADIDRLTGELAAAKPFRDVVEKRYGKFKDPVAAVDQDAQWMDDLEAIKHMPEAQKTIQMIEAKRKGETVAEPTRVRETKPEAQAPVAAAPSEAKAEKVLRRLAGDLVNTTLVEAGVRPWARDLVKEAILADESVDLSELDAEQTVVWAREFFEKRGMTAGDVLESPEAKTRKPPAGRGVRAAGPVSPEKPETPEKPLERAMSTWNPEARAAKRRAVVDAMAVEP